MLVLILPKTNGTEVAVYGTKVPYFATFELIAQAMLFKGKDWFTANNASSNLVETPSLSKILLR